MLFLKLYIRIFYDIVILFLGTYLIDMSVYNNYEKKYIKIFIVFLFIVNLSWNKVRFLVWILCDCYGIFVVYFFIFAMRSNVLLCEIVGEIIFGLKRVVSVCLCE